MRMLLASVLACFVCAGCGGGGGAGSAGSLPGGGSGGSSTGLVPAPGVLGAVLYAKATDIRPVVAGAEWSYHTHDYTGGGPGQLTTRATSTIPDGVIEVDSDNPSEPTSVTVDPSSSSVSISAKVSLSQGGQPLQISGFELRSPVRINDQYVLLDTHASNSGIDVDGDGKPDEVDIAMWRVVQGQETVTLPAAAAGLPSVRVDTFLVARFTPSHGGSAITITGRTSTWYAPGLGAIRNATHSTQSGRAYDQEAWLTGYDGVGRGFGAVVRPAQHVPGTATATGPAVQAIGLEDGALVSTGSHIVKVGKDGRVASAITWGAAGLTNAGGSFVSTSGGLRYVVSNDQSDIRIFRVNDDGTLQSGAAVTHLNLADFNPVNAFIQLRAFAIAPRGDRFWMAWLRSTVSAGNSTWQIVLRAFDPNGNALGGELVLVSTPSTLSSVLITATPDNGVLATWSENGSVAQARVASGGAVQWLSRQNTGGVPGPTVFPLADGDTSWLAWRNPSNGVGDAAYGVRLDTSGQFVGVGTSAAAFSSERLTAIDSDFFAGWPSRFMVRDGRLFACAQVFSAPYPDDSRAFGHVEYAEFDGGTGRWASALAQTRRFPLDGIVAAPSVSPIVLSDRVLLLTDDGGTLKPVVVWR